MGYGKTYRTKWLEDLSGDQGTAGQILSTTSSGISWIDASTLPGAGLWVADGNDIYNSNSGNVGIGTTSPSSKLDVRVDDSTTNDSTNALRITHTTSGTTANGFGVGLGFFTENSTYSTINEIGRIEVVETSEVNLNDDMLFYTKGNNTLTEKMRIDSTGNVGIGTTSPSASLQIGSAVATSSEKLDVRGNSSANYVASFEQDHVTGYGILIDTDGTLVSEPALKIKNTTSDLFYVGSNGNVGIGTTSPSAKLEVDGDADIIKASRGSYSVVTNMTSVNNNIISTGKTFNITTSDEKDINIITNGSVGLTVDSSQNVGIGTTSPDSILDISAGTNLNTRFRQLALDNYSNEGIGITFSRTSSDSELMALGVIDTDKFGLFSRSGLIFATGGGSNYEATQEAMRIDLAGNVGIGTTSPSEKLEVDGKIKVTAANNASIILQETGEEEYEIRAAGSGLFFKNDGNNQFALDQTGNILFYKTDGSVGLTYKGSSGNIGIGTDSPSAKLDVTGSARLIDSSPTLTLQDSDESNVFASIIQSSGSLFLRSRDGSSNGSIVFQKQNSSGITESMRIDDSGNVGIGTSSPVTKAHIKGDGLTVEQDSGSRKIQIIAPVSGEDSVIRNSGTSAGFDFQNNPSGDGSTFIDLMTIDSSGNVGIGTATPSAKLEVNSGTTNTVAKFISSDSGAGIVLTDNTGSSTIQQTDKILRIGVDEDSSVTDSAISFRVDNSEKMRIDDTGNVGIGTTSPLGKLMVRDDTAGTPTRLIVSNGGTAESGTSARLSFYEGTSEKGYIERRKDGSGKIAFVTPADDNPFVWENPTGEIMRIDNGNVGIGTTSPSQKLEVSGSALIDSGSTNTALLLRSSDPNVLIDFVDANTTSGVQVGANSNDLFLSTGNSERMRIDSTGNVGIGTDSPLGKLHVNGASDGNSIYTAMLQNAGTAPNTASKLLFVQGGSTIRGAVIGGLQEATAGSPTSMVFETSAAYATPTERMRITSAGNVGIGTTSPSEKLEVDGVIKAVHTDNTYARLRGTGLYFNRSNVYIAPEGDNVSALNIGLDGQRFSQLKLNADTFTVSRAAVEFMRVTSSGNVGIGTTSPNFKLHVDGGSAMFDTDGGNNPLYIARNSSASESLKIYVDDAEVLFESIQDETGGDHGRFAFKMDGDSSDAYTRWLHGSTERMRLTAGGNLGIGTTAPNASALLDVSSTTKGVLLPRMNTTQINAISSPAEGLTVYNTVLSTLCFFNGVSWQKVTSTAM